MFMTIKQASEKWGISDRRIRVLCSEGKIPGAYQDGRSWKIPSDAEKPADGRYKSRESILSRIEQKKKELDGRRPLTEGEVGRYVDLSYHILANPASTSEFKAEKAMYGSMEYAPSTKRGENKQGFYLSELGEQLATLLRMMY